MLGPLQSLAVLVRVEGLLLRASGTGMGQGASRVVRSRINSGVQPSDSGPTESLPQIVQLLVLLFRIWLSSVSDFDAGVATLGVATLV